MKVHTIHPNISTPLTNYRVNGFGRRVEILRAPHFGMLNGFTIKFDSTSAEPRPVAAGTVLDHVTGFSDIYITCADSTAGPIVLVVTSGEASGLDVAPASVFANAAYVPPIATADHQPEEVRWGEWIQDAYGLSVATLHVIAGIDGDTPDAPAVLYYQTASYPAAGSQNTRVVPTTSQVSLPIQLGSLDLFGMTGEWALFRFELATAYAYRFGIKNTHTEPIISAMSLTLSPPR